MTKNEIIIDGSEGEGGLRMYADAVKSLAYSVSI